MDFIVKKSKHFIISLACLALLAPIAALGAGAGETPKAFFPTPSHTFDPVVEGRTVLYTYTIQNKGDKPLEVQKVRTG